MRLISGAKRRTISVLSAAAIAITGVYIWGEAQPTPPHDTTRAAPTQRPSWAAGPLEVAFVTDGDTIGVRDGDGVRRIRLIGVDTPETKKPGVRVQCWGPQASANTRALLAGGQVWLEADPVAGPRDKYNRELAYVWSDQMTLINLEIIAAGHGREMAYRNQEYRYRSAFSSAQDQARTHHRGLWGNC